MGTSMERDRFVAISLLLVAVTVWGASYVVTKGLLSSIGPFTIMLGRFVLAYLALLPLAWRRGFRPGLSFDRRIVSFGVMGMVLHLGLEIVGLSYTSAASAALVVASAPAVTAATAFLMERARLSPRQATGIALSVIGVVAVTGAGAVAGGTQWIGNLLVFGGVITWGIYTVQARRIGSLHSPLVSTVGALGISALLTIPLAATEVLRDAPAISAAGAGALVYLGLGASAVAYLAWNAALTRVDASTAAPFVNLVPVIGLGLGVLLGDSLTWLQIAGGATVGIGVAIGSTRSRAERAATRTTQARRQAEAAA